jgi:hypothetical protein
VKILSGALPDKEIVQNGSVKQYTWRAKNLTDGSLYIVSGTAACKANAFLRETLSENYKRVYLSGG